MGLTLPQYVSGWGWTSGSPYTSLVEARKYRAPFSLARPRVLWVPKLPILRMGIGMRSKSTGDAGLAKCRTASTGPETWTNLLTSECTNVKSAWGNTSVRLSSEPVIRLSMATTESPRGGRYRHRGEPRE